MSNADFAATILKNAPASRPQNNAVSCPSVSSGAVGRSSRAERHPMRADDSHQTLFQQLEQTLDDNSQVVTPQELAQLKQDLRKLSRERVNLLITGPTGAGKSSTINALFAIDRSRMDEQAQVGSGVDPLTKTISQYRIGNLTLWDSPGLGDGRDADQRHSEALIRKLHETDANGQPLIDLVLVILDGSSRDLGTSYELINDVIIPHLGDQPEQRILVAVNQADQAMKGRHWNRQLHQPDPVLKRFLQDKCDSIRERIHDSTGVRTQPIYYSAGYKEQGHYQEAPYNMTKLLALIIKHIPHRKRLVTFVQVNPTHQVWEHDDEEEDYGSVALGYVEKGLGVALGAAAAKVLYPMGQTLFSFGKKVLGGAVELIGKGVEWFTGLFS